MVLLVDIQQGVSLNWRWHLEGMHQLVALRGGFHALAAAEKVGQFLHCFWYLAVIGNTTSPRSHLVRTDKHVDSLELMTSQDGATLSLFSSCPPALVKEMVRINHLRSRICGCDSVAVQILWHEADEILYRIQHQSLDGWIEAKPRLCACHLYLDAN